jgi:hypothetical protein
MPLIIILAPQFWHLGRLSMIFSGLGIISATDAWHRAESVMQHIQHLSFESLVKMDHFPKEPQKKKPLGHARG